MLNVVFRCCIDLRGCVTVGGSLCGVQGPSSGPKSAYVVPRCVFVIVVVFALIIIVPKIMNVEAQRILITPHIHN